MRKKKDKKGKMEEAKPTKRCMKSKNRYAA